MPTLEETRKLIPLESEVVETREILSEELKKSRETIDVFLLTMSQFKQNLNAFTALVDQFDITEKVTEFLNDVAISTINYEAHFLNNFQKLMWKLKEYIASLPKKQRLQSEQFYRKILLNEIKIERYKQELNIFTGNCMRIFRKRKGEILTKEDMKQRLNDSIIALSPFTETAPKEVFEQLSEMGDILIQSRILIQR